MDPYEVQPAFISRDDNRRVCIFQEGLRNLKTGIWQVNVEEVLEEGEIPVEQLWEASCGVELTHGENEVTFTFGQEGCDGEGALPLPLPAKARIHLQNSFRADVAENMTLANCTGFLSWRLTPVEPRDDDGERQRIYREEQYEPVSLTDTYCVFEDTFQGLGPGRWLVEVSGKIRDSDNNFEELRPVRCRVELDPGKNDVFLTAGENECTKSMPWPGGSTLPPL
ncbi:MAG: hypothetical protein ACYSRP_04380 [Planctomycetota bacterium]